MAKGKRKKEPIIEIEGVKLAIDEVAQQPPNIQYTSDPTFPGPPKQIRIGMKVIELPDATQQRAGFYSEHAVKLAKIKAYKLIQPKG